MPHAERVLRNYYAQLDGERRPIRMREAMVFGLGQHLLLGGLRVLRRHASAILCPFCCAH